MVKQRYKIVNNKLVYKLCVLVDVSSQAKTTLTVY